ncbi:MAG: hypothetical protein K2Q28_14495 [Hyphomicrobium sp.]|nr:hypothetical protein [Hyphomicrobium sp.]
MSILSAWLGRDHEDDMARSKKPVVDESKIDAWVARLKLAVRDAAQFDKVFGEVEAGELLGSADIIALAQKFAGGPKPKNKKAALLAIAQERQRLAHAKAKGDSAAKTRVW